jgi:hypothetical protein
MMIRRRQDFMVRLLVQVATERMCNTNKRKWMRTNDGSLMAAGGRSTTWPRWREIS